MVLPQHKNFAQFIADGKRHSKAWRLPEKECNKLDLTAAPCFWLANHNNYLGALLLVVSHLFPVPVLVLWVGLEKNKKKTKPGCEKYFGRVKYGVRDALGSHLIVNILQNMRPRAMF